MGQTLEWNTGIHLFFVEFEQTFDPVDREVENLENLVTLRGVANGKIRDSPRRLDPCLKIRVRDFILRKSDPVSKTVRSET